MMMKILSLAVVAFALGLGPAGAGAQSSTTQTVRIQLRLTVPKMAVVRSVAAGALQTLPGGQQEVVFAVTVGSNCRWTLGVRRLTWWDRRPLDSIQVQRADGEWVPLLLGAAPVTVIPDHEACTAEAHDIRVRVRDADAARVFERVEFVVAPLSRD